MKRFEDVIWRLLALLTVVQLSAGGFMVIGGISQLEFLHEQASELSAMEWPTSASCEPDHDEFSPKNCAELRSLSIQLELNGKSLSDASNALNKGYLIFSLAPLQYLAFFVARWTLTGHWKRQK